jgi:3-oxoacyl-[acyl-carrier-protein] synthase-3
MASSRATCSSPWTAAKYWEPGTSQGHVAFTEERVAAVITRGNRLVPQTVADVCTEVGIKPRDIDTLVTNQPNRIFLRNWREALELTPDQHPDTFDDYGNLFGAAIPITLDHALRAGRVKNGAMVMLAGFAHAGDYSAAATVRWCGA